MISGKNYIGNTLSATGTNTYKTINPKLNVENPWIFYEATEEELNAAVELASKAFDVYRNFSDAKKAAFLRSIAQEIESVGDELIYTYMLESGLPEGRARGERGRTLGQLRGFATLLEEGSWVEATIDTAQPDRKPMPMVDIRKMLMPLGPIGVFGSSNFPLAYSTAGGDTASALAAGCPVIVKSHPMHAGTGELVAAAIVKAAQKTGMPDGVFSNLNSSGIEVGKQLTMHPNIKGIGFTGSIKGGTALYKMASERKEPIPVFAEMGSVNPVIALPSALDEKGDYWATQYAASIALGGGQFCTNPGLIFGLKSEALNQFTSKLGKELLALDPSCMLHPNIQDNYEKHKLELSSQSGAVVVAAYESDIEPNYAKAQLVTVQGSDFLQNPRLHQEVFGPFSMVVQCEDVEELCAIVKKLEGQLTGTLLGNSNEMEVYSNVVTALQERVGRIIFNGVPTGVEVCAAMQHGGPFPASSDSRFSAVGPSAIKRWARPIAFQNWPQNLLPDALKNDNPLGIVRMLNNTISSNQI